MYHGNSNQLFNGNTMQHLQMMNRGMPMYSYVVWPGMSPSVPGLVPSAAGGYVGSNYGAYNPYANSTYMMGAVPSGYPMPNTRSTVADVSLTPHVTVSSFFRVALSYLPSRTRLALWSAISMHVSAA